MPKFDQWRPEIVDLLHRLMQYTDHQYNSCALSLHRQVGADDISKRKKICAAKIFKRKKKFVTKIEKKILVRAFKKRTYMRI